MTIRLTNHTRGEMMADAVSSETGADYCVCSKHSNAILAIADTHEEALEAKRAFENVLAPRFTRDEAIAIVKAAIPLSPWADVTGPSIEMVRGIRLALEALAAACVFSDECRDGPCRACAREMSDKLDAAGIK